MTMLVMAGVAMFGHRAKAGNPSDFFSIKVVDSATSRGVPLVELVTVNQLRFITDSHGLAAIREPGFEGQRVFFSIKSHGYEYPRDGFGIAGVALDVRAGQQAVIPIKRVNITERLYRITGEGIYRDSVLLGQPTPLREPVLNGQVLGQDSVFAVPYQGAIRWFWGDTNRPSYPLGQFRTSGAMSQLPGQGGLDPAVGVDLDYVVDETGFSRPMFPMPDRPDGVIWMTGLTTLVESSGSEESGPERLVGRFTRMKDLGTMLDHGLAVFNDERQIFERIKDLNLKEGWRFPEGHPVRVADDGKAGAGAGGYLLFPRPYPVVRVRASWADWQDPALYEAFTCLAPGTRFTSGTTRVERDPAGRLVWDWKRDVDPLTQAQEAQLIEAGAIAPEEARFQLRDAASGKPVMLHGGSFYWNEYLKAWIMIGVEIGGTSMLGEVWFARADAPTGPWRKAVKIVTHDQYSFYNPTQHPFFDQEGGRLIYFEGTYTNTFSGPNPTPRYDYNQIMYRLDLSDPRLGDL